MEAGNSLRNGQQAKTREIGALVLQTGRQAGATRPLGTPTTFLGRGAGCDIRLNVDGVDALHCLIVNGPDGVQLRDLDSAHGTYLNGTRTDQAILHNDDILKVGPFQFRVALAPETAVEDDRSVEEMRDALRIQAAAIAAQQASLEDEEIRLHQRRSDLQQQEEQLAEHLDEKQRQVQLWADFTKAEREALRKEKAEQEKHLAKLEKDLWHAREDATKEHHRAAQARLRIEKVYQRLRQRWQRQWSAERSKHQRLAEELAAERFALNERQSALHEREANFAAELVHVNAEREVGLRRLRDGCEALKKEQDSWRRRRSQEHLVLKARARELAETQIKVKQMCQMLAQEKDAWEKEHLGLQKELHGLNNRIVHQRLCVQEQHKEIARLDSSLRERRLHVARPDEIPVEDAPALVEMEIALQASATTDESVRRCIDLDRLAGELADQRAHLIEQYKRLAEIHDAWQRQRDHAAGELEALATRLIDEEQALAERERHASAAEDLLQERTREIDTVRQELQGWRAQLKLREQSFAQQYQKEALTLRQHQKLLDDQLAGLAVLRKRWNLRRLHEIERLQAERMLLAQEQKQTQDRRLLLFEKGQQVDEEKRILAEKALALEQYRQEVLGRAKDPTAMRRIERLRRRWLTLNSALIRNAKSAGESTRKELAELEALRSELADTSSRLTQDEASLADKQALLEERETALTVRRQKLELELRKLQTQQTAEDVDVMAQAVYEEPDGPIEQAA